jgi:hypothetical protein
MPRKLRESLPLVLGPDATEQPLAQLRVARAIAASGVPFTPDQSTIGLLADACLHRSADLRFRRRGLSDSATANQIFFAGVMSAMPYALEGKSLLPTSWQVATLLKPGALSYPARRPWSVSSRSSAPMPAQPRFVSPRARSSGSSRSAGQTSGRARVKPTGQPSMERHYARVSCTWVVLPRHEQHASMDGSAWPQFNRLRIHCFLTLGRNSQKLAPCRALYGKERHERFFALMPFTSRIRRECEAGEAMSETARSPMPLELWNPRRRPWK